MWLVRIKKSLYRSGEVAELPGSLPWLVSHSVEESCGSCRSPEQGTNGAGAGAGWVTETGGARGQPGKIRP